MNTLALRLAIGIFVLGLCLLSGIARAASGAEALPGSIVQDIRTELFDAQAALLAGDQGAAADDVAAASDAATPLLVLMQADAAASVAVGQGLDAAADAVQQQDTTALTVAAGQVWASLMTASYAETVTAVERGDAAAAKGWLLARDFRPTTKFSRPNANATLAVQGLGANTVTPEAAAQAVRADLLDTYQAATEAALAKLAKADPRKLTASEAKATGEIAGYWPLLARAYSVQEGPAATATATTAVAALELSALAGDPGAFAQALQDITGVIQSFRAAPLSADDQARRGGQLLRYLSLTPMEYGRGVKQGQVFLDLELQEAIAFQEAAQAAFADLRLPLRERDAAKTAEIETTLDLLTSKLEAAAQRTEIAAPAEISAAAATATNELSALFPPEWKRAGGTADFDVVSSLLDQVEANIAAGQPQQAESSRLEAYAIFEVGPEKRLLAFAPDTAQRVEQLFWEGDGGTPGLHALIAGGASVQQLQLTRTALNTALAEAQERLGTGQVAPAAIVFNAATIVFREGLEAVLILASLLASMVGANTKFKKPLAIGALAALVVTAFLFIAARELLASLSQYTEIVEAVVSVIAIAVLLVVMNWFFHKVYWTKWIAGHHDRRRKLLIGGAAGQMLGLVLLGFTSVFREGAETVLFLQALVLDAGTLVVLEGVALGLAATLVVGVLTLVLQTKLPHKKMLIVTGMMIAFVLVTMVGGTVHTLQIVGWLPITTITPLQNLPYWLGLWFGLFPTWQGLIGQLIALVVVVGSYFVAEESHKRSASAWRVVGDWLGSLLTFRGAHGGSTSGL